MAKRSLRNWAIGLNPVTNQVECIAIDPKRQDQLRHLTNPSVVKGKKKPSQKDINEYLYAARIIAQLK